MAAELQAARSGIARLAHDWRDSARTALRHPLLAPTDPPYRRAGIAWFYVVTVASVLAMAAVAGSGRFDAPLFWPVVLVAIATGLAEIHVRPERQTILNDLFYVVPFAFYSPAAAAAMILAVAVLDPILHPRSLTRAMARLSSILVMRIAMLGGVVVGRELVPQDHWWSWAAVALAGLAGGRINDYCIFPISLRLGLGPGFSYRDYVVETFSNDVLFLGLEVPLIAIAATAWPHAPWLVVGLAIPYFATWRLALLRPKVDALREADELKGKFLSMASHELRTPLTAIAGFSSTLLHRWETLSDEQRREFIGVIDAQSARLSRMIDQLLTMSRIEAGALVTRTGVVEVRPLLERALAGAATTGVAVRCEPGLLVRADPDHLEQIVINFLGNAGKYGAPPVELEAEEIGDGYVEIRVVDHGEGVPEHFRPHMYDQFAQASTGDDRSARGTGLGLSIVARLAEAQDAVLDYREVTPHGACFVVRVPAAAAP